MIKGKNQVISENDNSIIWKILQNYNLSVLLHISALHSQALHTLKYPLNAVHLSYYTLYVEATNYNFTVSIFKINVKVY